MLLFSFSLQILGRKFIPSSISDSFMKGFGRQFFAFFYKLILEEEIWWWLVRARYETNSVGLFHAGLFD